MIQQMNMLYHTNKHCVNGPLLSLEVIDLVVLPRVNYASGGSRMPITTCT